MSWMDRLVRREFRDVSLSGPGVVATRASSQAATGNVTFYSNNQVSIPDWDATSAVKNGYLANIYVHKAVRRIAEDLSALPFRAGADPSVVHKFNPSAPLARFLGPPPRSPNPIWSARQMWEYAIVQFLVTGRFGWLLERDDAGQIINIWPLVSQYLNPIMADKGDAAYFKGFKYGIPGTSAFTTLGLDDVIYVYRPSAYDVKQPESVLEAARINVSVASMIDQFEYNFYRNNAVPSHLIFTPPFAEPEARRAFQEQFRAEFGGYTNAGKAMFLESGYGDDYGDAAPSAKEQIVIQQLGTNAEDAQTTSARDSHIQDISVAFGVPLSVLGDSTHSKFQNADMDERNYWKHTVQPLGFQLVDAVNTQLAPLLGTEVGWFDYSGVSALTPDKTIKPAEGLPLVLANIMTRDELRAMHGLGPYIDVDPTNAPVVVPAGIVGVKATPGPVDAPPEAPVDDGPVREAERILELRHAGHEDHLPIPGGHLTASTERKFQVKAWEHLLTQQLKALMDEQRAHVQGRMVGRRKGQLARSHSAEPIYDAGYWLTRTKSLLGPVFDAMALDGADREHLSDSVADLIVDDTRTALDLAVVASLAEPDALASAVGDVFTGRGESAARIILAPFKRSTIPRRTAENIFTELSTGKLTFESALTALENAA